MEKKRRRSSRRTSAIEADRQAAMGAMQAQMGIEALRVAALRKGLLEIGNRMPRLSNLVLMSSGLGSAPESSQGTRSVTQDVGSSVADVQRICSTLQLEPRDLWLVDPGATCHVPAASYASSFRIVRSWAVRTKRKRSCQNLVARHFLSQCHS